MNHSENPALDVEPRTLPTESTREGVACNGRAEIENRIRAGAWVSCHARKWNLHVATGFPLAHHYREVFDSG